MREQQQRLLFAGAVIADHHVHLVRGPPGHHHVGGGKPLREESLCHCLRGGGGLSRHDRCVDFDELFVDFVGEFLILRGRHVVGEQRGGGKRGENGQTQDRV